MTSWQGKQNSSRAEKLNTNQSEQRLRECYVARGEQLVACGHLRFLLCTRGMNQMQRRREDDEDRVKENAKTV